MSVEYISDVIAWLLIGYLINESCVTRKELRKLKTSVSQQHTNIEELKAWCNERFEFSKMYHERRKEEARKARGKIALRRERLC